MLKVDEPRRYKMFEAISRTDGSLRRFVPVKSESTESLVVLFVEISADSNSSLDLDKADIKLDLGDHKLVAPATETGEELSESSEFRTRAMFGRWKYLLDDHVSLGAGEKATGYVIYRVDAGSTVRAIQFGDDGTTRWEFGTTEID